MVVALVAVSAIALIGQQLLGQRRLAIALGHRRVMLAGALSDIAARVDAQRVVSPTNDQRVYAFTAGLLRPHVYVSDGLTRLLSDVELEAVVRHEIAHVARRDPLRFLLARLARPLWPLWPLLPALRVLDSRVRLDAEIAADRAAVAALGLEPLATAMIAVTHAGPLGELRELVVAFSPTNARVAALLGRSVRAGLSRSDLAVSFISVAGLAALLVWLALQPFGLPAACNPCGALV